MRKIICRDSCTFDVSLSAVFAAVADVGTYNEWWEGVKVKVVERQPEYKGSKVEIKSNGGRFFCEITGIVPGRLVEVNYYKGVVRGKGTWLIEVMPGNSCVLHYNIDLVPYGFFPGLLSNFLDFPGMHSRTMKILFAKLGKYLERK